jgi:type IV fimbrial biogenesis protein FimT
MVTVAIVAILLVVGIPSFTRLLASTRLSNAANDLVGGMNLARSEAIRRGHSVTLRSTGATAGDFHLGWQVITDSDADGAPLSTPTTSDGAVIRVGGGQTGSTRVVRVTRTGSSTFTYAASAAADIGYAVFSSRGAFEAGPTYFRVCDANNSSVKGRVVQVSLMGKVSIDSTAVTCP